MTKPVDIVILSNGPGEVTTWVRPVVKALRQELGDDPAVVRISVVLSPCPNATGKEGAIALSYPEVDRVQAAEDFWQFLLWGKTAENWDWRDRGVVVFLGGDQIFPVVIGKKLGYSTVVYAEWDARWHNLIDRFAVMQGKVAEKVSPKYAHKFTVVGDLMLEAQKLEQISTPDSDPKTEIIGLLPGSKAAKLAQGVPLSLAIAEYIHARRPETKFVIPVAPTLDLQTLASFADSEKNPLVQIFGGFSASLVESEPPVLQTEKGLCVELCRENPAYEILSQCAICLTTVGANTAELGALAVPMIVMIPTQQLDAMRSWDGLPGLLANLPGVGSSFAKVINWLVLRNKGLLAWPNIWAQEEIVPELVGKLQPPEVGEMVLDFLNHPEKLAAIRAKLRSVRGESGAAERLVSLVTEVLSISPGD
ncbi:lipid-A-disaccharide synthase [Nodularia harveyana UHCC-0300]|uniref:Lipid-A-disaccharide synthase n=1 Tax=Nodularia harveyana UHCC-0300 TaxID=2974287 RepID=A0ABU5UCM6_9CYAN|nr:lipid-A-disaccharide synthase [Nodularia harveyana]MEA5580171.1 lipid-A-disaccharide synthase [Nodularia harveyana UHCC-0300]